MKSKISRNFHNLIGWKTNKKLLVIESDDWGTVRMPSKKTYDHLLKSGFKVDECPFNKYDCLENNADLEALFEVLNSVKDKYGNPAKLTANNVVCNPDFQKIRATNYQYHYETFDITLKRYPNAHNVFNLYQTGIKEGLFWPQFHGREHVHINHWIENLKNGELYARTGIEHDMFSISRGLKSDCRAEYLDALASYNETQEQHVITAIEEGTKIFRHMWGYNSKSMIAPCYIWHTNIEKHLPSNHIHYLQSGRAQICPVYGQKKYQVIRKKTGQKSRDGLVTLTRNVYFEPSTDIHRDWVDTAMAEVKNAFLWHTPAIISTHRLNYVGGIVPKNRDNGLIVLKSLLHSIIKKWPDIIFVSSDQLGDMINKN